MAAATTTKDAHQRFFMRKRYINLQFTYLLTNSGLLMMIGVIQWLRNKKSTSIVSEATTI